MWQRPGSVSSARDSRGGLGRRSSRRESYSVAFHSSRTIPPASPCTATQRAALLSAGNKENGNESGGRLTRWPMGPLECRTDCLPLRMAPPSLASDMPTSSSRAEPWPARPPRPRPRPPRPRIALPRPSPPEPLPEASRGSAAWNSAAAACGVAIAGRRGFAKGAESRRCTSDDLG